MLTAAQLAHTLRTILTTTAETATRDARFIKRERKLTGAAFVQGLVFGWLAHPEATYDQLVQAIARAGSRISPRRSSSASRRRRRPAWRSCWRRSVRP